jgi:hypothetical protein
VLQFGQQRSDLCNVQHIRDALTLRALPQECYRIPVT